MFEAQGRRTAGADGPVKENGHRDADALEHFVNVKMLRVINRPDIVPMVTPKDFSMSQEMSSTEQYRAWCGLRTGMGS